MAHFILYTMFSFPCRVISDVESDLYCIRIRWPYCRSKCLPHSSDADPVELLYGYGSGSGSRIRDPEILHTNSDPDPGSGSGSKEKLLIKFNSSTFCGKNVLTDLEKQLYIKLAKVPRGQLRLQKGCKVP